MPLPILCDGVSQLSKKGINIQIAVETKGKHKIFQNQDALVSLNLNTITHKNIIMKIKIPTAKNSFRFAIINSLKF